MLDYLPERFPLFWFELRRQQRAIGVWRVLLYLAFMVLALMMFGSGQWAQMQWIEIILFSLITPSLTAGLVSLEREHKTLDSLVCALAPERIVLEKYAANLAYVLLLYLILCTTALVAALVLHEPSFPAALAAQLMVLPALFGGAGVGLLASASTRNMMTAQIWAYMGILPIPFFTLFHMGELVTESSDEKIVQWFPLIYCAYMAVVTVAALVKAYRTLDSVRAHSSRGAGPAPVSVAAPAALPPAGPRDMLPEVHPMLWFELRRRVRGDSLFLLLFGYLLALGIILVLAAMPLGPVSDPTGIAEYGRTLWMYFSIAQTGFLVLISPGLAVGSFSTEREQGTLEGLLMTPLTGSALFWGKLVGALGQIAVLILASLPVIALIALTYGGISPLEVGLVFIGQVLVGAVFGGVGLVASCYARNVAGAAVRAYIYVGALGLLLLCSVPLGAVLGVVGVIVGLIVIPVACVTAIDRLRNDSAEVELWRGEYYYRYRSYEPPITPPPPPMVQPPQDGKPPVVRPPQQRW